MITLNKKILLGLSALCVVQASIQAPPKKTGVALIAQTNAAALKSFFPSNPITAFEKSSPDISSPSEFPTLSITPKQLTMPTMLFSEESSDEEGEMVIAPSSSTSTCEPYAPETGHKNLSVVTGSGTGSGGESVTLFPAATNTTSLALRRLELKTVDSDFEEKSAAAARFTPSPTEENLKYLVNRYQYNALQALIRANTTDLPTVDRVRNLALKTGDFCLLYEMIKRDIEALRSGNVIRTEAQQELIINMLTHYILTVCDSVTLVTNIGNDSEQAFKGLHLMSSIFKHWLNKHLADHISRQPDKFNFNAMLELALNRVTKLFEINESNGTSIYTSIPGWLMRLTQATRVYGTVNTFDITFGVDEEPAFKAEIKACSTLRIKQLLNAFRLEALEGISETLRAQSFASIFGIDPYKLTASLLESRPSSPYRNI